MRASRWLQGLSSPKGVMHLRDVRTKTQRALCGAAAIGTVANGPQWRVHEGYRAPTCVRCRRAAAKRYGVAGAA